MLKVYVAGKVQNRRTLEHPYLPTLPGIEWLEPYIYNTYLKETDAHIYAPRNFALLNRADIFLALLVTGEERSTLFEMGIAYARGLPIVAVCPPPRAGLLCMALTACAAVYPTWADGIGALRAWGAEERE